MNILIVDPLPFFIQGMASGLKNIMQDIEVKGVIHPEDIWEVLEEMHISVILIDGGSENSSQLTLLDDIAARYPHIRIIVMLMKVRKDSLRRFLEHHAIAVVSKEASLETIFQVIKTASCGMICIPNPESVTEMEGEQESVMKLSDRQREVLKLIAAGESNKQISRLLNISAGTVKSHLESIYRRLNVRNRTQAAMMMSPDE
jgi:DNA-binding NarL/FixJ family response regulator